LTELNHIIRSSKFMSHEANDNVLGYPMPNYVAAWKTYRTLSNEDDQIAKCISRLVKVPNATYKILDIGPGDGRVLVRTIIRLDQMPSEVTFVEPNEKFARETMRVINFDRFAKKITPVQKKFGDCENNQLSDHDLILCTHTAYFLDDAEFERMLSLVDDGARLIVIFDHERSIFSQLWQRTAPEFFRNTKRHREKLDNLDPDRFVVEKSEISAEIGDPRALRPEISNLVLSMLCYSDVDDMHVELLASVNSMISEAQRESVINCVSSVYDIISKS
jgi:hypothetical protein